MFQANQDRLLASCIHVDRGGIAITLAKASIAGQIGIDVNFDTDTFTGLKRADFGLFSESKSRFIVSINPENKEKFEALFPQSINIGTITNTEEISIKWNNEQIISSQIKDLTDTYKVTFKDY